MGQGSVFGVQGSSSRSRVSFHELNDCHIVTTLIIINAPSSSFKIFFGDGRVEGALFRVYALGFRVQGRGFELLRRNVKRFLGGLLFKAHRRLYHSTQVREY